MRQFKFQLIFYFFTIRMNYIYQYFMGIMSGWVCCPFNVMFTYNEIDTYMN